jgi:hypothetical protein
MDNVFKCHQFEDYHYVEVMLGRKGFHFCETSKEKKIKQSTDKHYNKRHIFMCAVKFANVQKRSESICSRTRGLNNAGPRPCILMDIFSSSSAL